MCLDPRFLAWTPLLLPQLSTSDYYFHVDREAPAVLGGEQQGALLRVVNTSGLSRVYVRSVSGVTEASFVLGSREHALVWVLCTRMDLKNLVSSEL